MGAGLGFWLEFGVKKKTINALAWVRDLKPDWFFRMGGGLGFWGFRNKIARWYATMGSGTKNRKGRLNGSWICAIKDP